MTSSRTPIHVASRPSVLLVDDEPLILEVLSRTLRRSYQTAVATSGAAGLAAIETDAPFAVIVSDMRMPGMNGAQFLARARALSPDSVRILLTGQADLTSAMAAVNEGQIFRFLEKPCPTDEFAATMAAAAEHYRLVTAERELLEQTLRGSIEVLTNVLALVSPVAFARSLRLTRIVTELADALGVKERWAIDLAAMLSQLGAITVPTDVLERHHRGDALTPDEREMIAGAPDVARQLIGHVPRLDAVREILAAQHTPFAEEGLSVRALQGDAIPIGARLLLVATDYDTLESRGETAAGCVDVMEGRVGMYDPRALQALRASRADASIKTEIRELRLTEVRAGMIFARDVVALTGLVLIGRGQEATPSLVRRIQNFWTDLPLKQTPQLIIPRGFKN